MEMLMNKEEMLKKYNDWKFRCSAYEMALSIIGIDKLTVAPPDGSAYRDERTAYLAGELFSIRTDPEIAEILKVLKNDETIDPDIRKEAELNFKSVSDILCIPKEEYVAFRHLSDQAYDAWYEAKTKSDYSIFEPYLKKIIEARKKMYGYRDSALPLYDRMLDDYEPGMTTEKYDEFFGKLKERLVPLIRKVTAAEQVDESFAFRSYPTGLQKAWTEKQLLPYLGFTKNWGYQNETEHPFTSWTCQNDCRTTTKYLENNVMSSIFSTIHETGHAWYEHNISPKYDGSILSSGVSSGMHESQSRFCENYLGRSLPFWEANYESLQKQFPEQLGDVTVEQFVNACNASEPSFVRTEADELTYPLHILIRYEIEKGLFSGEISVEGLDQTWNEMYKKFLGVDVPDAAKGILQDVHWSSGDFGYFPTYALGSAFGAQFYRQMRKEMDVDEALRSGNYLACISWLKEHIHQYGCRYNADEIMRMATGEPFDPEYYIEYLEEKYTKLYHLD